MGALRHHRQLLLGRARRLADLMHTIDRTIQRLTEKDVEMRDEELYEGFSEEQIAQYKQEARERYDPELVRISEERLRRMSKDQWQALKAEGDEVTRLLADLGDRAPDDAQVQALIARHHAWIERFYPASADVYRGLGQGYAEHEGFCAFYDQYRTGLADLMAAAMAHYADCVLAQA